MLYDGIIIKQMTCRLVGYAALTERYGVEAIPNWHRSQIADGGLRKIEAAGGVIEETYPAVYWPGDGVGDHLEFALKYDGTNLALLACLFRAVAEEEILAYVRSTPTGKYARRIWYLYEFLTGRILPLDDLTRGNYVDLLPRDDYYTIAPCRQVRRQRINDNLPGDARFCPVVRRSDALRAFEAADIPARCRRVMAAYPPASLVRALSYLYTKETKSSFDLEHITPESTRTERFVALLRQAEREDFCEKGRLIGLQNRIVDARFQDADFRSFQNYVGENPGWQKQRVHYACPKPADLPDLMAGLEVAHQRMQAGGVPVFVHAAVVAYGFVFLHPFGDGNGRIHRFLIHNILARRGFTPSGLIFPVSSAMVGNLAAYDASLEAFSRPLMRLVEYRLDEWGEMTVQNDTADWYRYMDLTPQAEALARFIEQAVDKDLVNELAFLANYDRTKRGIQDVVDMPDRLIDLLLRLCIQNGGRLSAAKRAAHFSFLTEQEVAEIERVIRVSREEGAAQT